LTRLFIQELDIRTSQTLTEMSSSDSVYSMSILNE